MEIQNITNIIDLLTQLLPGFISVFIFYSLTPHANDSVSTQVIIALIFTVISTALSKGLLAIIHFKISEQLITYIIAIALGLVFSILVNHDIIHKCLRKWKITFEISHPSEWYGIFTETVEKNSAIVVLHLNTGQRICGGAYYWPTNPLTGHFVLESAKWLVDDDEKHDIILHSKYIMIKSTDVVMVEFFNSKGDEQNAKSPKT